MRIFELKELVSMAAGVASAVKRTLVVSADYVVEASRSAHGISTY
jgi:hypothetical protein